MRFVARVLRKPAQFTWRRPPPQLIGRTLQSRARTVATTWFSTRSSGVSASLNHFHPCWRTSSHSCQLSTMSETKSSATFDSAKRLAELRRHMADRKLDAFIVPSGDAHNSEYVADCDKRRGWLTGFHGSAGTAVVTTSSALLWTDGRYHNQAAQELGPEWTLMKQGLPKVPNPDVWLSKELANGSVVGLDATVTSLGSYTGLKKLMDPRGITVQTVDQNLVDLVWAAEGTRPAAPSNPIFHLALRFTGQEVAAKLAAVRGKMEDEGAAALVVAALDEVAWLFNLRGSDIEYNPVFFSYALITDADATLYTDASRMDDVTIQQLQQDGIRIRPYSALLEDLQSLQCGPKKQVWLDGNHANLAIYQAIGEESTRAASIKQQQSPIAMMKAVKNETELKGMRDCHIRDAAAVVQFLCWLEDEIKAGKQHDEVSVANELERLRSLQADFKGLSFETISASGPNGAIIHYAPSADTARPVNDQELFLLDSGAQYCDGTTDITRTLHLGTPTDWQRKCFTLVLKGHIALASAVFPPNTAGPKLDTLARAPLWQVGLDYRHGTGHGVGAFLNVHEGPHGISSSLRRSSVSTTALKPGMTVTNEPGYYEDGQFGIRIESVMIVRPQATENQFGGQQYLGFDTIALAPIQKKMLDLSIMSPQEIQWLDRFHADCLHKVGPLLSGRALDWMRDACAPITAA